MRGEFVEEGVHGPHGGREPGRYPAEVISGYLGAGDELVPRVVVVLARAWSASPIPTAATVVSFHAAARARETAVLTFRAAGRPPSAVR